MSYIIAIDVGIKNLGLCVFDFTTSQVVYWKNVTLVHSGRYLPASNVQYVREFIAKHRAYFENAFIVLVERQMRCNMRIIEAVIQTMFFERCLIISARSVKMHYNLSTKNYKANKQRAVEWAKEFISSSPQAFANDTQTVFSSNKKLDDLADSLLLCMYYLDTYSNQLTVE
jgi:hypothetical protein